MCIFSFQEAASCALEVVLLLAVHLTCLALAMPASLTVCQVCLLNVNELCSRAMDPQPLAQLAHRLVTLLYPFPQQLRVRRIPHLALIAGRIRVHRIQVLHI